MRSLKTGEANENDKTEKGNICGRRYGGDFVRKRMLLCDFGFYGERNAGGRLYFRDYADGERDRRNHFERL
jgi:hypothetical protein